MQRLFLRFINSKTVARTLLLGLFFSTTALMTPARAQFGDYFGFGKNKVHYKNFDWSVIHTEHFDVYFYEEERQAALDASEIAERSYAYLSEVLDYKFKKKIPLLLYASHNDFQQTNAIQSYISDGTQGVTESLKGRMILPITGSYAQFTHVLTHELVHAFQFDILLANDAVDLVRRFSPPLWFMEGMAEYLSVGLDNITRMWMRDAVLNNTLLTIPEMGYVFDIRVYRMGQAIWYYVGERYGIEVVGRIFKTARATGDMNRAFKAHTGLDLVELSKRWQDDARNRYLPKNVLLQKPADVADPINDQCVDCSRINIVPALSPDGSELAYIGDKDYTLNMFLRGLKDPEVKGPKGKDDVEKIVTSGSSQSYETLRYFNTSMNWSPDGKTFSFVAKAGKNDAIYIVDAEKGDVVQKLSFPGLTGMAAPSWSPTGDRMIFTGLEGGISNMYMVNADGSNLVKISDDRYAHLHPQWSPDGKKIAFTTDRGPNTDLDNLIFGEYNIALYDIETGQIELLTETGGNHINPTWSQDGREILYISDMSGIPNIYSMDLETYEIYQITNFITGVAGIITESPAISLAPRTGRLAFSAFWNGGWNIYTMDDWEKEEINLDQITVLEPLANPNDKYLKYALADSSEFLLSDYKAKLTPDLIVGGGGFGTNVGFAGQTAFLFSDMLGDKTLLIQAALYGDPLESTIIASYYNQSRRINWALTAFQFREDYGLFTPSGSQIVSQIYRGAGVRFALPLNTFTRFEVGNNLYFISEDVINSDFQTSHGSTLFTSFSASLIRDTVFWGIATPVSGTRARFTFQPNFGGLQYNLFFADYRKYFAISLPRYSIAYRFSGGVTTGSDKRIFGIGGPFTFRGLDYGDLRGTRAMYTNLEFRFPLLPFLPMQYDFLTGLAFFDAANVGGEGAVDLRNGQLLESGFDIDNTYTSYGLGLRFNLGGLLVLRWDFPFKKEEGAPGTHFSIGLDF